MYVTRLITELIGSFFFIGTILVTGEAIPAALGLLTAIYFGGKISGGHFNPAVSTAMWANGKISTATLLGYVIVQIIGGLIALAWVKYAGRTERTVVTGSKVGK